MPANISGYMVCIVHLIHLSNIFTLCSPKRDWLMDRQGSAQDLNTSRFLNFAADEVCCITCAYLVSFGPFKKGNNRSSLSSSSYNIMFLYVLDIVHTIHRLKRRGMTMWCSWDEPYRQALLSTHISSLADCLEC